MLSFEDVDDNDDVMKIGLHHTLLQVILMIERGRWAVGHWRNAFTYNIDNNYSYLYYVLASNAIIMLAKVGEYASMHCYFFLTAYCKQGKSSNYI